MRKPGEGVGNIVGFNWHFYALAAGVLGLLLVGAGFGPAVWRPCLVLLAGLIAAPVVGSLLVSWYVYDLSALYSLSWLDAGAPPPARILNVHAGFDETSSLLQQRFERAELRVFDFYDPREHTEVSIHRARAAGPPFPGTVAVLPHALPLPDQSIDQVFVLLAAHEIRQPGPRVTFFREIRRVLAPGGTVVVVEHLRDPANFLAYTIGFLHFYSRATWQQTFAAAGLRLVQEKKITPFVSAFFLQPDGNPA